MVRYGRRVPALAVRHLAIIAAVLAAVFGAGSALPAPAPSTPGTPVFTISGRGWGHGVGMSQWGAFGMARRGSTVREIVAHYYPGTTLGRAPVARVRVLLADGRKSVMIGSASAFTIRDATGSTYKPAARRLAFGTGLRMNADGTGAKQLRGPLTFTPGSAPLELGGKRYRGTFEVAVTPAGLRVVDYVGLEQYLWGVVPGEMPDEWPADALKAQAVVARSYALAVRRSSGPFDLYADVRSQVYGGVDAEETSTTAAVNATSGQVLLYGGRVATTFFFSTSGGRTARIEDVWPGSTPTPYLVSVPDPLDVASPHHRWGPLVFTRAKLAKALGTSSALLDARTTRNPSGRAATLVGVTRRRRAERAPPRRSAQRLGLRSTWFTVGVLRLDRPVRRVWTYGGLVRLKGLARGVGAAALETKAPGGAWARAAAVKPSPAGLDLALRATAPTEARLTSGAASTDPVRIAVAPRVTLRSPGAGRLTGSIKPAVPGARVAIQRRTADGTAWRIVATLAVPRPERGRQRCRSPRARTVHVWAGSAAMHPACPRRSWWRGRETHGALRARGGNGGRSPAGGGLGSRRRGRRAARRLAPGSRSAPRRAARSRSGAARPETAHDPAASAGRPARSRTRPGRGVGGAPARAQADVRALRPPRTAPVVPDADAGVRLLERDAAAARRCVSR